MSTVQATNLKHGSSATNNVVLDASGNTTISGNAVVAGTLQANGVTGSVYPLVLGTAVASTSGTAIDFTGIPSWVRRITVMFNNVSLNGTSSILVQLGTSSGVATTGYTATSVATNGTTGGNLSSTAGFPMRMTLATLTLSGHVVATNVSGNLWVSSHTAKVEPSSATFGGGDVTLSGVLDRVRITTVGGTDTFDAGSINIMFE